ncbi:MAG: flagellin [Planctomycetota bacterium]
MGLRINTNVSSVAALRNLQASDRNQQRSLERLSTGLRVNGAGDDPAGLVISEQLRAQIGSMKQALENSQNASNLLGTTEAALNEVNSLLIGIRESVIFALNSGASSTEEIDAEQDSIDNAIRSIDRIAQTTKFATKNLLDGSQQISVTSQVTSIADINVQNVTFDGQTSQQYTMNVTALASQAGVFDGGTTGAVYGGTSTAGATFRLSGSEGTQDISVSSATTLAQFVDAVNAYTGDTGVFASSVGSLHSVEYGEDETVSVQVISGTLNAGGGVTSANGIITDDGADLAGDINGITFSARGHDVRVQSDVITADIRVQQSITIASTHTFTVDNSGMVFQLNHDGGANDREQVGVRSVHTSLLGENTRTVTGINGQSLTIGGFLSSLVSGSGNDLDTNAVNALRIVDDAIEQVSDLRAYLGAFQNQTVDSNASSLAVALENLTASESTIRDLDFAEETAAFTKNQILYQSGIAVLAQSNLISQSVLTLLG